VATKYSTNALDAAIQSGNLATVILNDGRIEFGTVKEHPTDPARLVVSEYPYGTVTLYRDDVDSVISE
jgi:hypothetical protein